MSEKPILKKPVSRVAETPSLPETTPPLSSVTTNPRDLDRSRAQAAWNNIQSVKTQDEQAKYGSLARQMPTLIQVNGLGQTLAFLKAKGNKHHKEMFNHLSIWVCSRLNLSTEKETLLDHILKMDSQRYRLATGESLAFLQWVKRFAEAELDSEDSQ